MSDNACETFKTVMAAALASADPIDPPMEQLRHLNACEDCQEWFDEHGEMTLTGLDDDEMLRRIQPFYEKLGKLETESRSAPDAAFSKAREEADHRLEEAIRGFIARHPELEPSKWGIPMDRYEPSMLFNAVQAVNMLLRRAVSRHENLPEAYGLRDDGEVFVGGESVISAAGVQAEIGESIHAYWKVPPEDMTDDLSEALRREAAWSDDATCAKLAAWIHKAVQCKTDLMRNHRMTGIDPGDPRVILLAPIMTSPGDRALLDLWKE